MCQMLLACPDGYLHRLIICAVPLKLPPLRRVGPRCTCAVPFRATGVSYNHDEVNPPEITVVEKSAIGVVNIL